MFNKRKQKPKITRTLHLLDFHKLSDEDFERLCFWVVDGSGEFDSAEKYGMTGDKKRDVIGYKHNISGKKEQWYFQCKRYAKISFSNFKGELAAIAKHSQKTKDFKPDVIVFVSACPITPGCKDQTKKCASQLGFPLVYFWTNEELDKKTHSTPRAIERFFSDGVDATEIAKQVVDEIEKKGRSQDISQPYTPPFLQLPGQTHRFEETTPKDEINKRINEAAHYIDINNITEAKPKLFQILGQIENNPRLYKNELVRVYNNLGVCFNRLGEEGDLDEAIRYFKKALDINPSFVKASCNLASAYLNKRERKYIQKAYRITDDLWQHSDKSNPLILQVLLWSMYHYKSPQKVTQLIEESKESAQIKKLIETNEELLRIVTIAHLELQNPNEALDYIERAYNLSPDSPENLSLKAETLMVLSQHENKIPSYFEIVPKFEDYKRIKEAIGLLDLALDLAQEQNKKYLTQEIKLHIDLCSVWLNRSHKAKYKEIRSTIDIARLSTTQKKQVRILDLAREFQVRNFPVAYDILTTSPDWSKTSYEEKNRLAQVFFLEGAPEQAKSILDELELEAQRRKDSQYWSNFSLIEVLLNNQNLAIRAAKNARNFGEGEGTKNEKQTLSHFNAIMLRYSRSGRKETDRLMEGVFEYNRKFPKDKIVKAIKVVDGEGEVTEEIKSILLRKKKWYEEIRENFRKRPIPTYFLERIFERPYADILSFQNDPEFTIEFNVPTEDFTTESTKSFQNAKSIIFDYSSLLDLAKMDLLGYLPKISKKFFAHKLLFQKIQEELLALEQEDLRKLWEYLRKPQSVTLIDGLVSQKLKWRKINDFFDKWLVKSIRCSKKEGYLFVTDDLRLLRFLKSENIKSCNVLVLLKEMLSNRWIDKKIYSRAIGDLAERFYTFLPFSGDDLFEIVMEDHSKIALRSYHLVNQMSLPDSIIKSFTGVFVKFIYLLWRTGSLPEDKVKWLGFLSKQIIELIEKRGDLQNINELNKLIPDFIQMWIVAIRRSRKNDLTKLEQQIDDIFNRQYLVQLKSKLKQVIQVKKSRL
ncbi:hypothetical protein ES702_07787 [subsurface metagenome]